MTAARLWLVLSSYWAAAALVAALARPPLAEWPPALAGSAGAAAGGALFVVASGSSFGRPGPAVAAVLAVSAVAEELLWRGLALGWLSARAGPILALAASSLLFGFAHPGSRRLHSLTGLCFGSLYLATGGLVAPCCAHVVYNVAVAGAAR